MEFLPLVFLGILIPALLLYWAYRVVKLFSKEKVAKHPERDSQREQNKE